MGLEVKKIESENGVVSNVVSTGEILNELANYSYGGTLTEQILHGEIGGDLFKEEIEERKRLLSRDKIKENDYAGWKFSGDRAIWLSEKNTHYKKNRTIIMNAGIMMYELADNLDALFGELGGKSFTDHLLEAKSNPSIQGKIQKRLDSVLGKGYYRKLKEMDYSTDNVLSLLMEAQSKFTDE